jgi:aminoglycoside phosphotransferase (APT) family kinase protein
MAATASADAERRAAALAAVRDSGSVGPRAVVRELVQLEGGWSRHTWALSVEDPDAGTLELIVRVRPPGALLETDLAQEYRTYELLAAEPVPTPTVHGMVDEQQTPFGGPFFVMGRLPGRSPNVWRRRERVALEDDWAGPQRYATELVDALAAIHALPAAQLRGVVAERGFVATLDHWQGVHHEMQLVHDPIVEEAYAWARTRVPDPVEARLVHGDYRIGNCLVHDGHVTGVLDWELAFVGDPRFDLGYIDLAYHAGKFVAPGSALLNSVADRDWFHARYTQQTGLAIDLEVVRTFSVVGLLMLSAILVTGLRGYASRQTDDIRMAWTRFALPGLRQDMVHLMQW